VFTGTLPRNGLHNPVVLLLLNADRIENNFPYTVAYLEVFIDPLPGNLLIKSVTIIIMMMMMMLMMMMIIIIIIIIIIMINQVIVYRWESKIYTFTLMQYTVDYNA
jgi:hypothetical protein